MPILIQFKPPKPVYLVFVTLICVIIFSFLFFEKHKIESSPYYALIIKNMNKDEEVLAKFGDIEDHELINYKGKNDKNGILVTAEYTFLVKGEKYTGKLRYLVENKNGEIIISHIFVQ